MEPDAQAEKAGAAVTQFVPKSLPWHVRVSEHVYIWAGGESVRRMPFWHYQALTSGTPVESEYLVAEDWKSFEEFADACVDHEDQQRKAFFESLPRLELRLR